MTSNIASKIIGVGKYLPQKIVTNHDLSKLMETSDEWIVQRSGIKERRWASDEEGTSDLALKASEEALKEAGLSAQDIDMIIFATLSPDHYFPGSGCLLQAKLGARTIPAYDIRQQCSGFVYSMSMADAFIRTGQAKNVLVVGAEVHSKGLDKTTRGRDVTVLFGDGAGAVILSASECRDPKNDSHIMSSHLHSEGQFAAELWLKCPGMGNGSQFLSQSDIEEAWIYPKMNGKKVFMNAVRRMCEVIHEGLQKNQMSINDIDLYLFHQANLRINEAVAHELKIPAEKVFNTISHYGNTTAATLPIGLYDAKQAGLVKRGMTIAMTAFGSGFTWANTILRY